MSDVIQELSAEAGELSEVRIIQRVDDWKNRIAALYEQVCTWLPSDMSADKHSTLPMHEDLMKKYDVGETEVPILNIYQHGKWIAKLVPRGLWIIGANGRLDLFARNGQWVLVDRAENFQGPDWQIAPAEHRRSVEPLTREALHKALGL